LVYINKKTRTLLQDLVKPLINMGGAAIRFRSSNVPVWDLSGEPES